MASQRVAPQQNHVDDQHQAAHVDAEVTVELKPFPRVGGENDQEWQGDVKKVAVKILKYQRKGMLATEAIARLTHGAGGRICPEGFVICTTVIITSQAETAGRPQDQNRRRKWDPVWDPRRLCAEPSVQWIAK